MELLRGVALEGERAVVIVTHDSRIFEFGDRIAQMEDGRVVEVHRQQVGTAAAIPVENGSRTISALSHSESSANNTQRATSHLA